LRVVPERFWIAEIQISEEMEAKIRRRRFVTGDEVREACVPDAYDRAVGKTTRNMADGFSSSAGPRRVAA
jgi:hypothetical protein